MLYFIINIIIIIVLSWNSIKTIFFCFCITRIIQQWPQLDL